MFCREGECFSQVVVVSLRGSKDDDEREGASLSIEEYVCCPAVLVAVLDGAQSCLRRLATKVVSVKEL